MIEKVSLQRGLGARAERHLARAASPSEQLTTKGSAGEDRPALVSRLAAPYPQRLTALQSVVEALLANRTLGADGDSPRLLDRVGVGIPDSRVHAPARCSASPAVRDNSHGREVSVWERACALRHPCAKPVRSSAT